MPSYAILGATGGTGGNILKLLSKFQDNKINVYVRNKHRFHHLFPDIATREQIHIFDGPLNDVSLVASCLENVSAVFACIAINQNVPGMRVAQDQAQIIVAALCEIRAREPSARMPKIILLSASSINPHLTRDRPALPNWFLKSCLSYLYDDLAHAESYLKLHSSWLDITYVQPGGLVEAAPRGHVISFDHEITFLSYADLAAGMIEVAETGGYEGKSLSINPASPGTPMRKSIVYDVPIGFVWHWMPWLWFLLHYIGLV
ncbi:MAG: hypothetical protein M1827_005382 [Pycnora praestabilis]|nr:MAG: hypothetical protein M1827_005382 [Pycnora praestabilis]